MVVGTTNLCQEHAANDAELVDELAIERSVERREHGELVLGGVHLERIREVACTVLFGWLVGRAVRARERGQLGEVTRKCFRV